MTWYRTRPGVVLTGICGEYLLVAAKSAREFVPYVTQLNESSAALWEMLENGGNERTLEDGVTQIFEIEDRCSARTSIRTFIDQMVNLGYLIPDHQEGEEHE